MGRTGGCGTALNDVKCGTMSLSNRMNAPYRKNTCELTYIALQYFQCEWQMKGNATS